MAAELDSLDQGVAEQAAEMTAAERLGATFQVPKACDPLKENSSYP